MGSWGHAPWDDDTAADWFADLMESTKLADKVAATLNQEADEDNAVEIRAAASVLVMMGRVYVWPVENYDKHLDLAVKKLEQLLSIYPYNEEPEYRKELTNEIKVLQTRLNTPRAQGDLALKDWWAGWM